MHKTINPSNSARIYGTDAFFLCFREILSREGNAVTVTCHCPAVLKGKIRRQCMWVSFATCATSRIPPAVSGLFFHLWGHFKRLPPEFHFSRVGAPPVSVPHIRPFLLQPRDVFFLLIGRSAVLAPGADAAIILIMQSFDKHTVAPTHQRMFH